MSGAACLAMEAMAVLLSETHGERMVAYGLAGQSVLQIWADHEDGTWSALVVNPDGSACMVAAGDNFAVVPGKPNL